MGSTQNHNSRKFVKVNDRLVLEWFQSRLSGNVEENVARRIFKSCYNKYGQKN